jgi:hypothetical protein
MNKLFLVHCGYYDAEVGDGIYESHTNVFVVAKDWSEARSKAKALEIFQNKRMHVDGLQEIEAVSGFRVQLEEDASLKGSSVLNNVKHRDLAPPKPSTT